MHSIVHIFAVPLPIEPGADLTESKLTCGIIFSVPNTATYRERVQKAIELLYANENCKRETYDKLKIKMYTIQDEPQICELSDVVIETAVEFYVDFNANYE